MERFTYDENRSELEEQGEESKSSKPGYPSVTKWTSGRKFGPTYNPDQKKWNGNGIVRGKANTLL